MPALKEAEMNPFSRKIETFRKSLVTCIALFTMAAFGFAKDANSSAALSDLQSYLARAQAENPQLRAFRLRYEAAVERIPQAAALPDPTLQVTRFVESVQTRSGPQKNAFVLSQRVPWFGKLSSREKTASAEAEALWFAYQSQQLSLARRVAVSFYEFGYTKRASELTEENLRLLEKLEAIVEEKVKAGGDLNELLRLKVEIGKVADRLQTSKQQLIAQSAGLSELLALPSSIFLDVPISEKPDPVELDEDALVAALETNSPELQMLERKIASAEARQEIARLESRPDFAIGVNYIQIGDPALPSTFPDAGKDAWGVSLGINIPIWSKKNKSTQTEALRQKQAGENEYANRLNELQRQLAVSLSLLSDANRRLGLYGDELIDLASQAVENSRSSYRSGRAGILEVIDSERSLLELQLLYWRAAADSWQQRVTLQTLANQPILGTFHATEEK